MGLHLNSTDARKADNFPSVITESGKYLGIITRAEKLISKNRVEGLGLSFKAEDGSTANYLDLYTVKPDGEKLYGHAVVQALLCCLRMKDVDEGQITFEKWDNNIRKAVQTTATGYPAMMGKRIGMFLRQELQTHSKTGEDVKRLGIMAVFEASTGLTASEILDGKTTPQKGEAIARMIAAQPVRDTRKKGGRPAAATSAPAGAVDFDDDIPF